MISLTNAEYAVRLANEVNRLRMIAGELSLHNHGDLHRSVQFLHVIDPTPLVASHPDLSKEAFEKVAAIVSEDLRRHADELASKVRHLGVAP